jgi:hypothetical protein
LNSFDIIIDTSHIDLEQVAEMILTAYSKWSQQLPFHRIWLSTKRIYPLENVGIICSEDAIKLKENMKKNGFIEDFPISLLKFSDHFFIYDGYKRFCASLLNDLPLIPVKVVARDDEEIVKGISAKQYVQERFQLSIVSDWETAYSFKYLEYPLL